MKKYIYVVVGLAFILQGCSLKTGYKQTSSEKIYIGESK